MRRSSTRSSDAARVARTILAAIALAAVGIAAAAPADLAGEVEARLARARAAEAAGDRGAAIDLYVGLAEFYRRGGDRVSGAVADSEAARVLIDIQRYDDAVRLLDAVGPDDRDLDRAAQRDHLRVIAHERAGRLRDAREVLLRARDAYADPLWNHYLRADAIRLGVDRPERSWGGVARGLLAIAVCLAFIGLLWPRRRAEIATAGVTFFVAVGLVEAGLRIILPAPSEVRHVLHPPSRTTVFHPERGLMPGVDYAESRFTTSIDGLRGEPLPGPGVMRVLAIGGSTTEALYLDDHDAWTAVLEHELAPRLARPVWVGNAGKSGLTSFAHVVQANAYVDEVKPDVVIVQAGINDLTMCISGGRDGLASLARQIRWRDTWEELAPGVFSEVVPPDARRGLRLQWLVDRAMERWTHRDAPVHPAPSVQQDSAASYYTVLRNRRAAAEKIDAAPDIDACLAMFRDNLRRIVGLVQPRGIKLVLVTQGSLYRKPMPAEDERLLWFGSVDRSMFETPPPARYYSSAVLADALARYNAVTLEVCAEKGLVCVDADKLLPHTTSSYYDDVHLNVGGARKLAEAIAAALAPAP